MNARRIAASVLLLCLCVAIPVSQAQTYSIRVAKNTNLRASHSLDSAVLASARAGTTLEVVGEHDRWLRVQRDSRDYWMASWVRHTRLDDQPPADIDNCCFVDRQCQTDPEWIDGYWAYQRNECAAPARIFTSTQPASAAAGSADNCCFIGWQCRTDEDWKLGYQAYQDNQCANSQRQAPLSVSVPQGVDNCCFVNRQCDSDADWTNGWLVFQHFQCNLPPATQGISIQGSATFVEQVANALRLLRDRAPQWWKYSTSGLNTIKMIPEGGISGVYTSSKTYQETLSEVLKDGTGEAGLVYVIFGIVHEACHVHEGHRFDWIVEEEKACMEASLHALQQINPANRTTIDWIHWVIANIYDSEIHWW